MSRGAKSVREPPRRDPLSYFLVVTNTAAVCAPTATEGVCEHMFEQVREGRLHLFGKGGRSGEQGWIERALGPEPELGVSGAGCRVYASPPASMMSRSTIASCSIERPLLAFT